ncbi:kelch domain-containing protein 7A [Candoia aspera]|uniref:kelch domain-containing protein 7A n=1 Tax=Candoia aspera TaxID=51853 RepID=UPI002FD7AFA9
MTHRTEGSGVQPSEMPLAGRLALSAAALLLLILAYRYYKSRLSPGSTLARAADASAGAEQRDRRVGSRMENNEAALGLRHRGDQSREPKPCHRGTNQLPQVGRCGGAEEREQAGIPAGRELHDMRATEAEEKPGRGRAGHPETGLQGEERGWMSEDKTEEMLCAIQSSGSSEIETDPGNSGSDPRALDLLSQESKSCSSHGNQMRPGWDADPVEAESGCAEPVGGGVHPTDGREIGLKGGPGPQLGEDTGQVEESQFGQKRTQSFHATSNGLAIDQSHMQSHVAYAFSSVARVQVEENFITERNPKEQNSGKAEQSQDAHLRGKVYNYYVQSTSQSVVHKNTNLGPEQSCSLSTVNMLNVSKDGLAEESAHSSVAENEADQLILEKIPDTSSNVLLSPAEAIQPEDQREAVAVEEAISCKPSVARYSLSRKESFHKIIDNPEFQVPMDGFGSPAIGPSSGDTLSPALPHSDSTSSLVRSMQNLQSSRTERPVVDLVAGARFFHIPPSPEPSLGVQLDLGNCCEVLRMAKKQNLKDLQEAVYKVMSDNYLQVLKIQAIYRQLNAAERDLILQKRMRGKKYMTVADINSHTSRVCYYDDQKDAWYPLTQIPAETISRGCAICSMFNYYFVVSGCEGRGRHQKPSKRVFCYNPLTNIWQEICPLNQARPHCKLVALDGCLYAIGGECLCTVERYDPRLDRWTFAAPLPNDTFAVAHMATVCNGEICVTGGTLRYMLLRYVGRTDTWKVSFAGGSRDRTTEMVTAGGFIYRFDLNQRMGISVYRCSAKARLWYECATHPMPFPPGFQCAVVGNLVYCISRQFNICFLADLVSPRFGAKELKNFPSPRGTLIPVTLTLPEGDAASQTRV